MSAQDILHPGEHHSLPLALTVDHRLMANMLDVRNLAKAGVGGVAIGQGRPQDWALDPVQWFWDIHP